MKTKEEILEQLYVDVKDILILLPVGKTQALKVAKELRQKAIDQKYFVPMSKKVLVPTKVLRKELKIWKE